MTWPRLVELTRGALNDTSVMRDDFRNGYVSEPSDVPAEWRGSGTLLQWTQAVDAAGGLWATDEQLRAL